jgi:hypothetical protein
MHEMGIRGAFVVYDEYCPARIFLGISTLRIDEKDVDRIMMIADSAGPVVRFGSGVRVGWQ